jgi:hypothetical protein
VLSLTNWYSVAEYFFAVNRVPYTTMPVGRLLEHLATTRESGRVDAEHNAVIVMLYNEDLPAVRAQTELIEWQTPAMRSASHRLGYSLYTIPDASQVRKPPFVMTDDSVGSNGVVSGALSAPNVRRAEATFADPKSASGQLGIVGYRLSSDRLPRDGRITVNVFWKALAPMSEAYTGFIHLVGPDGQVAAQDDHELGRGMYRTLAWSTGETIRERYEMVLRGDKRHSEYRVRVGAYRFPSLTRLAAWSETLPVQDDAVTLATINAEP